MPRHPPSILKANKRYGPPRVKGDPVTAPERKFCEEFAKTGEPIPALLAAWPEYASENSKFQNAKVRSLRQSSRIKRELEAIQALATQDAAYSVADFIADNLAIWHASPNELVSLRLGCCRHCHGESHAYQWTDREYAEAVREVERDRAALRRQRGLTEEDIVNRAPDPDTSGGFGYEAHQPPHPDCPECGGEGVPRVVLKDTTNLTADGERLFAGIRMTKYGPEIQLHDRMAALERVGRAIGAYEDRVRIRADVTTNARSTNFETTDPNVAAQAWKELMGQTG